MNESGAKSASQKRRYLNTATLLVSAVSIVALLDTPVLAQSLIASPRAPEAGNTTSNGSTQPAEASVPEIVVTATRHTTNLQNVPVTVTALPASTLGSLNITAVSGLSAAVPGLTVSTSGGNNLYLRGVGTNSAGYNEAQVAVYVDGLYLANPAMSIFSFNNIDQIEVLKGPQGTLYGRNATAGLIAVTTRDPRHEFHADGTLGFDSYQTRTETLYATGPITDTLAGNISVYDTRQYKGWGKNVFTGNDVQKNRETGVQAKLLWQPTTQTRVTTNFIYDTNNRTYGLSYQILPGTIGVDGTPYLGKYRFASRVDPDAPFYSYIGSLKVQQDLGFATLMSLTGYQKSSQSPLFQANNAILGQPLPGQGSTIFHFNSGSRTLTEELQLASKSSSSRLEYLAGFYYYNDKTSIGAASYTTCVASACANGAAPNVITGRPTTVSYSGYVDATYRFFHATKLTVGLRYTDESKHLSGEQIPLAGFPNSITAYPAGTVLSPDGVITTDLHFNKLTYRIVLSQDLAPNVHAYASDNLGFKSGTFNANSFTNPPASPEILHSYEAGVKSEFFNRRVRLNIAYFYYDYKDVQIRSAAPPAPPGRSLLLNVGKEHIKGVDGDINIVVNRHLTVNGGFEILDAKYVKNPGQSCSTPGPNSVVGGVTVGSVTSVTCDLAGYDVSYAPPVSVTAGLTYKADTEFGLLTFSANDSYTSPYPLTPDGFVKTGKYHMVNASLIWTAPSKRFDVKLYVQNLAKEYTFVAAYPTAAGFALIPGAPRVFGITAGFHL